MKKEYVAPCLVEYGRITDCTFAPSRNDKGRKKKKKRKDKFDDSPGSSGS